jgi:hypothetical protein
LQDLIRDADGNFSELARVFVELRRHLGAFQKAEAEVIDLLAPVCPGVEVALLGISPWESYRNGYLMAKRVFETIASALGVGAGGERHRIAENREDWWAERFRDRHAACESAVRDLPEINCTALWMEVQVDEAKALLELQPRLAMGQGGNAASPSSWYIDLDGMAALINKAKRTLEHYKKRKNDPLSLPDVEGGGGRKHEWKWSTVRPWLERNFTRDLSWVNPANMPRAGI